MRALIIFLLSAIIFNSAQAQLIDYDLYKNPKQVELSKKLKEISGLTISDNGRLFAHGDEKGTVYQLDIETGKILKEFELGKKKVEEDFEDIAIVNDMFYLVVSNGDIYEFKEGEDGEEVEYKIYKTDLKSKYDVEGICYDPQTNSLLLACKEFAGSDYENSRAVYSFDLKNKKLVEEPKFVISLNKLEKKWEIENFTPSAIERHPLTENYFILGGKGLAIIEISKSGTLINQLILDKKYHNQPEGLSFLKDGTMIISDEADKNSATLTYYNYYKD